MRVSDLNWMQLEAYLERDDRIVLPLASTEQHAYLSLATDVILAERVAVEAAEPIGVPVLSALPYGLTPQFTAYPGSTTLRLETFAAVVRDLLDSLYGQGFRRILVVNGHGGNRPIRPVTIEWAAASEGAQGIWHDWWVGPKVWAVVEEIDPNGSHANWAENFPWTRLEGVELPDAKPMADFDALANATPKQARELLGDGSFGGLYQRSEEEMLRIWSTGVEEVRGLIEQGWG
jgi:creatinine amidohydrolase